MLQIRRDAEIHAEEGGWFSARWHFSFDRYRDPDQMGIGPLRGGGPEGGDVGAVHQDAATYVAALEPGAEVEHTFAEDRAGYLYVIAGAVRLNEDRLGTGGGVKVFGPEQLRLAADEEAELILIDVPQRYTPVGVWAR